jgi:hypothetical protein
MKHFIKIFISILFLWSCNSSADTKAKDNKESENNEMATVDNGDQQLNINILWDLSDRIDPLTNPASPEHYERDIEVIKTITSFFKKDMEKRGAYKAKGRIKVFFTPTPENERINTIAGNLSCDLSSFTGDGANKKKKEMHDSIETRFFKNANEIYRLTIDNNKGKKQWDGSDVWRFFKNDVKDYCIASSGNYRNILVILTDGYIYHRDSRDKQKNRTAYILPELLKPFRNNPNWQTAFISGNYGLISTRKDLQNLEVLVLEITPSKEYKNDEDILKTYLGKWFEEMGIPKSNYACYNSDLPEYSKKKIESFLNRK